MCPVIPEAGHFVLSAEFPFLFEPVVEQARAGDVQVQPFEREHALGFVVGIEALQLPVYEFGKGFRVGRRRLELHEPFVRPAFPLFHKDGGCGEFIHFRARFPASVIQGFGGVVNDYLFAEGVDKQLCASRNLEFVGFHGREHDGVAYHVPPEPAVRGDYHGVIHAGLHFFEQQRAGLCLAQFAHRHKLIIYVVVQHQQHRRVCRVVLQAEEAFRGVVGLHVLHLRVGQQAMVLFAVGRETDAPVDEQFQVRPHLVQVGFPRALQYLVDDRQEPRRHAREAAHVLLDRDFAYFLDFLLPIAHQHDGRLRRLHQVCPERRVRNHDGREVAIAAIGVRRAHFAAAAQGEGLPPESRGIGIQAVEHGNGVLSAPEVAFLQPAGADGNELALCVRRARRLGKPPHVFVPQQVVLAFHHPFDVGGDVLVMHHGQAVAELFRRQDGGEIIFFPVFRPRCACQQILQSLPLHFHGVCLEIVDLRQALLGEETEYRVDKCHNYYIR